MLLRRLAIAIGLLCGLIGAQGPEFAQQYRQRLGGAIDELNRMIADFDAQTAARSLTRSEGLKRLETNDDPLARERGEAVADDVARADRLERQQQAMRDAGPLARLAALIGNFDAPTMRRALADFEPAIPVTAEALVIGLFGAAIGWATTHLVAWPLRRKRGRRADSSPRAA